MTFKSWDKKWIIKTAAFNFIYICLFGIQPACTQEVLEATPASELKRLRDDLLSHYDKIQRPVKDLKKETRVLVYFDARRLVELDEKSQTLTINGQLMMKWTDEHLQWDPASYSGISMVRLKPNYIWIPDIHSIFSVAKTDIYDTEDILPVQVYSNGTMKWYPPTAFDIPCSAKYRHYPFDSHNCSMLFGAWTHRGSQIILRTLNIPSKKRSVIGTEWMLTNLTHRNKFSNKTGNINYFVQVDIFLQRTSTIIRYVCVVPTLIVFLSSIAGFWLSPNDGSRFLIGCSNIILMSLLLQYLAVTVPAGKDIPLLAQYCASCLCMSGVFLLITVLAQNLRNCSKEPPVFAVRLAQNMDQYLCLLLFSDTSSSRYSALGDISSSPRNAPEVFPEEEKRKKEWTTVSLMVDRIAFWIFVFTYVVLLAVLASV
ncbi:hypothetical protein CDAR_387021 [Caerostris darwini]|uniref:Neurotransmitter-gated ion-channel ligand-binding domain-containing protein n=1 Tax=Caerostris darwini TaxID=1538125 RepID=A0AAV4PV30_9ARAC|nr:hypothetical protein CDAR_387021 [Caerostris darwini]